MAILTESPVFTAAITRIETSDPVLGGSETAPANIQAKQLANRTAWLKEKIDSFGVSGDVTTYAGNLNSLSATGLYFISSSATNRPGTEQTGFCMVMAKGTGPRSVVQFFLGFDVWQRNISIDTVSTYGAWVRLQRDAGLVGSVAAFAMTTPPPGWLKCNGAIINRTNYLNLYLAIGETFGSGDGSTTFQLPDLRGEFIRGLDDGRGVDTSRVFGSAQGDELKTHKHVLATITGSSGSLTGYGLGSPNTSNSLTGAGIDNVQGFGGTETRPRNIALLYCIKY